MDRYEISYLLGERYCDLIETRRRQDELKMLLEAAKMNDEPYIHDSMDNEFKIMETKIQIKELKHISKILDLDWKLVRHKAVQKFEIEL
jgi:hypothetical protein